MKDTLNSRVKHREEFRPFAGSVTEADAQEYFVISVNSPFMLLITQVRNAYRSILSPIVHIDGSVRLQTVSPEQNPRFHKLLIKFKEFTGYPILLNTSLNDNGEPIISSCEDAIRFFMKSDVDYLVIDRYIIKKNYGR